MSTPILINCPACNAQVSNQAPTCPRCGQPISGSTYQPRSARPTASAPPEMFQQHALPTPKRSVGKTLGMGCLAMFGVLVIASALINSSQKGTQSDTPNQLAKSNSAASPEQRQTIPLSKEELQSRKDRVAAVNAMMNDDPDFGKMYAGLEQKSDGVTVYVTDRWNGISDDMKTAFVKQFLTWWGGFGANQKIKESPSDLRLKIVHKSSGRVVATHDALFGLDLNP